MRKEDMVTSLILLTILVSIIAGVLIGQYLRIERARLVEFQPFGVIVTPPDGFRCFLDTDEAEYSYTVVCEPWK